MLGTVIVLSTISVIGAISETMVENEKTKELIRHGILGAIGAVMVGYTVHTLRVIYK